MIKTINAANKRMQRMRKKGYTKGDEYRKAQAAISRTENDNPFIKDRTTLKASNKMTSVELRKRYRTAKQIVKKEELTVAYVKKEISEKKIKTFETEKGIVIKNKRKFFDLLNSTLYQMPYNTILTLVTGQQTKLSVLLKFIEEHKDHFQIADMNQIIVFISAAPYHIIKPFMEYVEDNAKQSELWSLLQE